jgi:hypothetical protein
MSQRTRPNKPQLRRERPTPPSTRPPTTRPPITRPPKLQSTTRPQRQGQAPSHEVYVQIATLQMARVRQQRIRTALQGQVDRCTKEIAQLNAQIRELYRQAGLQPVDPEEMPNASTGGKDANDDGFEYQY